MRILQLISHMETYSGPVRTLAVLSRELLRRGHEVTVAYYKGPEGPAVRELREAGVPVTDLGWGRDELTRSQRIRLVARLARLCFVRRIQALHAHNFDADMYATAIGPICRTPVYVTVHSRSYMKWVSEHERSYRRRVFPHVRRFACVSDFMAGTLVEACPQVQGRTVVVRNGVSDVFFNPGDETVRDRLRKEFYVFGDKCLIGFAGNYNWVKGFEYFLGALRELTDLDFRVVVAGGGYDKKRNEWNALLEPGSVRDRIVFTGPRTDMPQIMAAIDIFVCSSVEESDSWVVSEALAAGRPVVAAASGGIPEKIVHGETGVLVPPASSRELADAIRKLIADPRQCGRLGANAAAYAAGHLSATAMCDAYEKMYGVS